MDQDEPRARLDKERLLGRIVAVTDELEYRLDVRNRARERIARRAADLTHGPVPVAAAGAAALAGTVMGALRLRRRRQPRP